MGSRARGALALLGLQTFLSACGDPSWQPAAEEPGALQRRADQNVALGKPITTSGYMQTYVATNANDGNRGTYWEGAPNAYPNLLTVNLGANHTISAIVLQLNPDSLWGTRTQGLTVLGHNTSTSAFSTLVAAATYTFNPATGNQVTIPVSATVSEVRLQFASNSGSSGAQIAEFQVLGSPSGGTATYALTVNNGSGGGTYAADTTVNITANTPPAGQVFSSWSGGIAANFGNVSSASTTYKTTAAATTLTANYTASTGGTKYEAEAATLGGSAATTTNHTGYSGSGFVEGYWFTGASTRFSVSAPSAGWYDVGLRYSNGFADSNLSVYVNGTRAVQTALPTTGNWDTWATRTETFFLNAGGNTLAYQYDTGDVGNVNLDYITVGATAAKKADLGVTDIQWTAANSPPRAGDAITFRAVVKNNGTAASPAATHKVSFRVNGQEVATATGSASIAAGSSATLTASAAWSTAHGTFPITAVVDPDNTIPEFSEGNNSFTKDLTVSQTPGPDLVVQSISPTPSTPAAGAAVKYTVAIANQGLDATGSSVTVRLVVDGTTTLTGVSSSALGAGATAAVVLNGSWTASNGNHTLVATVDPANAISESVESNNTLSSSLYVGRGANVPWIEYEAEVGTTNAQVQGPSRDLGTIAGEASGRKAVVLSSTGHYVQWTTTAASNAIVVRNSIPDAPGGGGIQATLSLYVNGSKLTTLTLSSKEAWIYGGDDTQSNSPSGGKPRRIYDEASKLLSTTIPAGATVRLQKDAGDTAAYYAIDLVDLELVAAPIAKPEGFVDITQAGNGWEPAIPNDGLSDDNAINQAIMAAQAGRFKGVYIPPGVFNQTNKYQVKGITIQGAGLWHSRILCGALNEDAGWGQTGFNITGDNTTFRDFAIFGSTDGLRTQGGKAWVNSAHRNTLIENMWVEHVQCGYWVGGFNESTNLIIRNSRFRNTGADAINLCNGNKDGVVENNHARNTGDDAFAIWSATDLYPQPNVNNVIRNCTAQIVWRAAGFAIYGGRNNRIENSIAYDTLTYPGLTVSSEFQPFPMESATVDGLTLVRTGGTYWGGQKFGSIWLRADMNPTNGITIKNVDIIDPTYQGISIQSNNGGVFTNTAFQNITISNPTTYGVEVLSSARGGATFTNVTVNNAPSGKVVNQSGGGFAITNGGGNNW
ncbi:CARDB domain-containing protein [Archangium primigenium]|uniref:CARDB domain-containing protein n=1 Tax=[Archangium] primigenium TaxID=2792470 RepID=UPI00195B74A8|nr:CARDB domain-containing protein [Archangium primigenium]MBM7115806.1 discoidin domain-containing protein [Archangium primigenium]